MDREDLSLLVVGAAGSSDVDGLLYDPLPGGSGLLQQILEKWSEVLDAAVRIASDCPTGCLRSCVDCLQTFRNAYYHRHLDRHVFSSSADEWGRTIKADHPIPSRMPDVGPRGREVPVNVAERKLRGMLGRAGFPELRWQHQIPLGLPLGTTTPDCFYPGDDPEDPGVCIYLDGLSQHIHGNPETAAKDREIRTELRSRRFTVIEIAASQLDEPDAMTGHFFQLAKALMGKREAKEIKERQDWFQPREGDLDAEKGA
jgi:hypothetical protein